MKAANVIRASIAVVVLSTLGIASAAHSAKNSNAHATDAKQTAMALVVPAKATQPAKVTESTKAASAIKVEKEKRTPKPVPEPKVCRTAKAEYPPKAHNENCR